MYEITKKVYAVHKDGFDYRCILEEKDDDLHSCGYVRCIATGKKFFINHYDNLPHIGYIKETVQHSNYEAKF